MATIARERLAYLAGYFDGEGYASVAPSPNGRPKIEVSISSTRPEVLDTLVEEFGGYLYAREQSKPRHKPILRWTIHAKPAADFLRAIRPWLTIKSEVVDTVLEYRETQHTPGHDYTPAERVVQDALIGRIHELNRRGR